MTAAERRRVESVLVEHGRFIEVIATRYAPSYDVVPDIVQDVSIRLCESLQTFRHESSLRTWLFRVTHNEAMNAIRRRMRSERLTDRLAAEPDLVGDLEAEVIDHDLDARRARLIGEVFTRGHSGLSARQIDALRHLTAPGNVSLPGGGEKSARLRAKRRLRRWVLEEYGELVEPDE